MAEDRVTPPRGRLRSIVEKVRSSTMARATLVTGVLAVVCKGIGFAKELLIASQFGVGPELDSYLIAIVLPTLAANVFAQSLAGSLVMQYIRDQIQFGEQTAREEFSRSMFWGFQFVCCVSVLGVVLGPLLLPWLSPGFRPELIASTQRLLWWLLPYSLLAGTSAIWSSILNARGRFLASAASPGFISLGLILGVMCFKIADARVLVTGMTLGSLLDVVVLGYFILREGLPLLPSISRWKPQHRWIMAQTFPMIAGSTLHFVTVMVDQSMATILGEGSVSELNYGNRFVAMAMSLIALPMGKILFPHFVQLIEGQKWAAVQSFLRRSILAVLGGSIPIAVMLAMFSGPIVMWTFRRGQFTSEMAERVATIQLMCALQIPFYLWSVLLARLAVALQMRRIMVGCGIINLGVNIAMNYLLMQWLGVAGIALSTAIVYFGATCYFSAAIRLVLQRKQQEQREIDSSLEPGATPLNERSQAA